MQSTSWIIEKIPHIPTASVKSKVMSTKWPFTMSFIQRHLSTAWDKGRMDESATSLRHKQVPIRQEANTAKDVKNDWNNLHKKSDQSHWDISHLSITGQNNAWEGTIELGGFSAMFSIF